MALFEIPIDSTDASYQLRTEVDGSVYILRFDWNSRLEMWHMSVYDADESPIVIGQAMVVNYNFMNKFKDERLPVGVWVLLDVFEKNQDAGREDLGSRHRLFYDDEASL